MKRLASQFKRQEVAVVEVESKTVDSFLRIGFLTNKDLDVHVIYELFGGLPANVSLTFAASADIENGFWMKFVPS